MRLQTGMHKNSCNDLRSTVWCLVCYFNLSALPKLQVLQVCLGSNLTVMSSISLILCTERPSKTRLLAEIATAFLPKDPLLSGYAPSCVTLVSLLSFWHIGNKTKTGVRWSPKCYETGIEAYGRMSRHKDREIQAAIVLQVERNFTCPTALQSDLETCLCTDEICFTFCALPLLENLREMKYTSAKFTVSIYSGKV